MSRTMKMIGGIRSRGKNVCLKRIGAELDRRRVRQKEGEAWQ
jgi:hypothetical protein